MKNGRYALIAGIVAGVALAPLGLQAAEQNDSGMSSMKEHGGQPMSTTSGEPATSMPMASPTTAPATMPPSPMAAPDS